MLLLTYLLHKIDPQWVVEAHRAGPLTLRVFRCPRAEALPSGILITVWNESVKDALAVHTPHFTLAF